MYGTPQPFAECRIRRYLIVDLNFFQLSKDMGLTSSKEEKDKDKKTPALPAATNGTSTTTKDDQVPTPPELTNIKTVETSMATSKIGDVAAELAREFMEGDGPKYWDKMSGNEDLVEVDPKSKEYAQVLRHFRKTSTKTVTRIERVQNKFLWRRYQAKKISMLTKNKGIINERVLFHGTRTTAPEKICKGKNASGFDCRLGNGYYGNGAYFATDSSYSISSYAYTKTSTSSNEKQIFLAQVLCGVSKNYGMAKATYLKRPPEQASGLLYDSSYGGPHVVGSTKSMMYVVYETAQSYPLYLYTYKN